VHFHFTREDRDPFFENCEVGPLSGPLPERLPLVRQAESDSQPEGPDSETIEPK
jgi:hypothetical protein